MLKSFHCLMTAVAACSAASAVACTSWMIHPSVSASGRMLVHKCRDNRATPLDAHILRTRTGVKWMCLGAQRNALFAVNEYGVAAIMNDGDPVTTSHPDESARMAIWCGSMFRQVMNDCTTAEQATQLVLYYSRNFIKTAHGNTIFFADAKRAFLIDLAPGFAEAKELTGGICIITNTMHLPGLETYSKWSPGVMRSDRGREANTRAALRERRVNGKYTVPGTIETSRLRCRQEYAEKFPCRRGSLSGVCFEIDPEFPQYLTTAYVALGPPQHTVYLPTPMALEQFPEEMREGRWGDLAYKLRDRVGFDHKYLPRLREFEQQAMNEYDQVREEARRLLKEKKADEAGKLLNDCYLRQFAAALKLLKEIDAESAANPPENKVEAFS
jgi:hypothetical protein